MRPLILAVLPALLVAACAPARPDFTKPGVSAAQVEADWEACKRQAQLRVAPEGPQAGGGRDAFVNPVAEADRQRAGRDARQIVESCMLARGYSPSD